jgi:ATP-dependent Clp protease protease subunit
VKDDVMKPTMTPDRNPLLELPLLRSKATKAKPRPNIHTRLRRRGSILISEPIREVTVNRVYFDILDLIEDPDVENITIFIHSVGGASYDYLPITDLIRGSSKEITTVGMGQVFSGALIVFMAGHKRYAHDHTCFMMHDLIWAVRHDNSQMNESRVRHFASLEKMHEALMLELTTFETVDEYREAFPRGNDNYFYIDDAEKYGIVNGRIGADHDTNSKS